MSKLETRLLEYEKYRQISSDSEFAAALEEVVAEEAEKKPDYRDYELLEEATSALASLRSSDIAALERRAVEIAKAVVSSVISDDKKRFTPVRRIIPIAAAVALLAAGIATSYAIDYFKNTNWLSEEAVEDVKRMKPGKVYVRGSYEVSVAKDAYKDVDSLEKLRDAVDIPGLLLPFDLSDEFCIKDISASDYGTSKRITFIIVRNDEEAEFIVETNNNWQVQLKLTEISGQKAYMSEFDGFVQAEFEHKGSMYTVKAESKDTLYQIIESLGE